MKVNWHSCYYIQERKDTYALDKRTQPKKSGEYLCTCIITNNRQETLRYLDVKQYDKEHNCWHDRYRDNAMTGIVLAWTNIDVADFDYKYLYGGIIVGKS